MPEAIHETIIMELYSLQSLLRRGAGLKTEHLRYQS